jgi:ribosomal-protein-serine acetyltransferase
MNQPTMKTELTDGTIRLRPYIEEDAQDLYEAVRESLSEMQPWMPWCHADYSIEESREWLSMREAARSSGTTHDFRISDTRTGRFLGGTGLNQINALHRNANLGYWIRTSATGQGIAARATRLVARFGFEELKLVRIEIVAAVGNLASQRVAEKVGAVREGVMRKGLMIRDVAHDAVLTSLVEEDMKSWQETAEQL